MPINPNIILGIKQQTPVDPLESYGKSLTLKNLMAQGDMQDLQMQTARQGLDDDAAMRSAYQQSGGDSATLRALLQKSGNYKAIQALEKQQLEADAKKAAIRKDNASAGKSEFDVDIAKAQHGAAVLSTAKDQATYDQARRGIAIAFGPKAAESLPEQFDPNFVQAKIAEGMTIVQKLADQREQQKIVETGRHNLQTEGNTVRGQDLTARVAREGHGVTMRGQNLTAETTRRGQDQAIDPTIQGRVAQARAAGKEIGEAGAQAQINLPQVTATAERGIKLIDDMIGTAGKTLAPGEKAKAPHAGFSGTIGATLLPGARFVPGTDAADFDARLNEIKGGAFLQAFESLKGGGAITEMEGQKATQAITRMERSQSEKEFVMAAREFQDIVRAGLKRAQQKAGPNVGSKVGGVLTQNPDGSYNYGAQ